MKPGNVGGSTMLLTLEEQTGWQENDECQVAFSVIARALIRAGDTTFWDMPWDYTGLVED